jgi:hypothetical protein
MTTILNISEKLPECQDMGATDGPPWGTRELGDWAGQKQALSQCIEPTLSCFPNWEVGLMPALATHS